MAAAVPTTETVSNNERLFIRYAQIFRQVKPNIPEYVNHAKRFAHWLKDSKAYYDQARPYIVKLLLFAQVSLRQALGIDTELAVPFKVADYFNHPSHGTMVNAYVDLVKSIRPFQALFSSEPALYEHIQGLLGTVTPGYPPESPSLNQYASGSNETATTNSEREHISTVPDSQKFNFHGEVHPTLIETSAVNSSTTESKPSPQIQSGSTSSVTQANATATVNKTRKKRKNIDFKLLVQHDLKGLMQKKEIEQASHIGPLLVKPTAAILLQSHTTQENVGVPNDESNATSVELHVNEQEQPLPPNADKEAYDTHTPTKAELGTADHEQTQNDIAEDSHAGVHGALGTLHQSPVPPEGINAQISPTTYSAKTPTLADISVEEDKEGSPMDMDGDIVTISLPVSEDRLPTSIAPPIANDPTNLHEPQMNVSFEPVSSTTTLLNESQGYAHQIEDANPIDMHVVAQHNGQLGSCQISFQFNITPHQFLLLSNWNNHAKSPSQDATCLTLGCYIKSGLENNQLPVEHDTSEFSTPRPSIWPPNGSLSMTVNFNNKRESLPLSPPFQVTPDNLVDVSPFIVVGQNVIELNQCQDLSQYTFILREHQPNQAQLEHLEEQRKKKEAWNEWVNQASMSFNVPLDKKIRNLIRSW